MARRLVRRLDVLLIAALLVTSGFAAVLFGSQFFLDDEEQPAGPQLTETAFAALPSPTVTPASTATDTPTATLTASATATDTPTSTPEPTDTATPTATFTPTATPWPAPVVAWLQPPIYAGVPLTVSGQALPFDTIHVYDNGVWIAGIFADDEGDWSVALPEGLSEGAHTLAIVAVSRDGATSDPARMAVQVTQAPPTPTATATPEPTDTPTATATDTPTATATPTVTLTSTPTDTATAAPSNTPNPTMTRTPAPTRTVVALAATDAPTDLPPTFTATAAPSNTPRPTATRTPAPTRTVVAVPTGAPSAAVTVLTPPEFLDLPAEVTAAEPVMLAGFADPGQTVVVTADDAMVDQVIAQGDGSWTTTWTPNTVGPVQLDVVTVGAQGQQSDPASVDILVVPPRPRIDRPPTGAVFSAGNVLVSGTAYPGTSVEVYATESGRTLGTAAAAADGSWQMTVRLTGQGQVTLIAAGGGLRSDPVVVTLAPPVQPESGITLVSATPEETSRTLIALVALLLVAVGFSVFFAGRVLITLARNR